ncbi:MAG: multiheme c-type cytochrome [Planctomycetota bacterium]
MKHSSRPYVVLASVLLTGILLSGCRWRVEEEYSNAPEWTATEASLAPPQLEDIGTPTDLGLVSDIPAPSVRTRTAHLITFSRPKKKVTGQDLAIPFEDRPKFGETHFIQVPPVPEGFDETEQPPSGPSPSDRGPVEIIPTPPATPEIKAEMIPTPQGFPEQSGVSPVARIAADPKDAAPKDGVPKQSMDVKASPGTSGLIDAKKEVEMGLVGQGPEDPRNWATPDAVLFITGDQHGYIEPCGCTGLDKQKGGVARRMTFMKQLRSQGWPLVPIDAGNQIRRIGQQAAIKFQFSSQALTQMKYQSVGFGPGDMRLSAGDLLAIAVEHPMYVAGNIVLYDPSFVPTHRIIRQAEWVIGTTSILDPEALDAPVEADVTVSPIKEATQKALAELDAAGANFKVLTFFGEEEAAKKLMADVSGFDLIVVSGGYGEPTYRPQPIEGSATKMILTGNKGMYAGLVALNQGKPMKYARVALTHEFEDAPEMRKVMSDYQQLLETLDLNGLGISPIPHSSGGKFVGTARCGSCHTKAMEVWEYSAHAEATAHIVKPPKERGDIARHFDPECISCHVTGWNPQDYQPYETGYLGLEQSKHLHGNGCENCHGPGKAHSDAEEKNSGASEELKKKLRLEMQLPLSKAKEHCMSCHDLDNSPDFHEDNAFEDDYWPTIEHYGVD